MNPLLKITHIRTINGKKPEGYKAHSKMISLNELDKYRQQLERELNKKVDFIYQETHR